MKLLFHTHTCYSKDCLITLNQFHARCVELGVVPIITDHNTIRGARAYQKLYGKRSCIIGEEIKTTQGEIIALYLKQEIPPFLTLEETMKRVTRQGAIIIIPHPFDRLRTSRLHADILLLAKKYPVHFIETFNSRTMYSADNLRAKKFYQKHNTQFKEIVGADAHFLSEFDKCSITVPQFDITSKTAFMRALSSSQKKLYTKKSPITVHVGTKIVKHLKLNTFIRRDCSRK